MDKKETMQKEKERTLSQQMRESLLPQLESLEGITLNLDNFIQESLLKLNLKEKSEISEGLRLVEEFDDLLEIMKSQVNVIKGSMELYRVKNLPKQR